MEITTRLIRELRERTGAGPLDCKKALQETKGSLSEAEKLLRKQGLAAAAKKAGRVAAEGLIGHRTDGTTAALVELNCETDFVARTEGFLRMREALTGLVFASGELGDSLDGDLGRLTAMPPPPQMPLPGATVGESVQAFAGDVGENTRIRRFARLTASSGARLDVYAHPGDKVVAVVETTGCDAALARDLAMHVVALAPLYPSRQAVPAKTLEEEREIARAKAAASGKPANVVEKMVEGMIGKWFSEVVLLDQAFAKDDTRRVSRVLAERGGPGARVVRFVRFKVGEGLDRTSNDLAAEVAALTK